jgi:deoxyribodipyrimidine photolyase-related protein
VGSKAYAASGNYTKKMSDYCPDCHYKVTDTVGEKACPLNSLYWQFMDQHQEEFFKNPRSKMVYSSWLKKTDEQRNTVLQHAHSLLENLDGL